MKEGHLSYRPQSDNPGKGTTLGGETDDPRREHTGDAAAGDPPGGRAGQCDGRLSRGGDLAHAVLSLARAADVVRRRRIASAPSRRSPRAYVAADAGRGAPDSRGGDR